MSWNGQTHTTIIVTLAAHARRRLKIDAQILTCGSIFTVGMLVLQIIIVHLLMNSPVLRCSTWKRYIIIHNPVSLSHDVCCTRTGIPLVIQSHHYG